MAARAIGSLALLLLVGTSTCAPSTKPTFSFGDGPHENAWGPDPRKVDAIEVHAGKPPRPFEALGPIEVPCPIQTSAKTERAPGVPIGGWPGRSETEVNTSGGCTYRDALRTAQYEAARMKADGLFGVDTTAASNGRVVLLVATAFRYSATAAPATSASTTPSATGAAPSRPPAEERLRELKELLDKGLITPADYERRKSEILREI